MLRALIEWWLFGRPEKKNTRSKGDRGGPAKNSPMFKLVSLLNSRVPTFQELCKNLLWFDMGDPYIESVGTVTCLVTSPIFVEGGKFRYNFHNGYKS